MTYNGTVDPRDPRRHLYLERRTRQILVAALRNDPAGYNEALTDAYTELGRTFANDTITAVWAILRQHADDPAAEGLTARIAEPILGLTLSLENYLSDGGSHDNPSGA
jgi:hypothetical protein